MLQAGLQTSDFISVDGKNLFQPNYNAEDQMGVSYLQRNIANGATTKYPQTYLKKIKVIQI